MHPIERLRYVARASGVPQAMLVREAAGALLSFSREPHGMVTACRRMISRQPGSGPLLWLGSHVLAAADPMAELHRCIDLLDDDPTYREVRYGLPDGARVAVVGWPDLVGDALQRRGDVEPYVIDALGEGSGLVQRLWNADVDAIDVPIAGLAAAVDAADVLVLESPAVGSAEAMALSGSRAAASVARHSDTPVWLVAGVGRMLPDVLFQSLRRRVVHEDPWNDDEEVVPLDLVTHIVGPEGVLETAAALQQVDCPVAPELLRDAI